MSIIPDCRSDEAYNEKYLIDEDAEFVAGFDWCRINGVENFFNNMDIYESEFDDTDDPEDESFNLITYLEDNPKIAEKLCEVMTEYIEMERDELITSMIDNMDDDKFETIKKEVDAGKRQNCIETYQFERDDKARQE